MSNQAMARNEAATKATTLSNGFQSSSEQAENAVCHEPITSGYEAGGNDMPINNRKHSEDLPLFQERSDSSLSNANSPDSEEGNLVPNNVHRAGAVSGELLGNTCNGELPGAEQEKDLNTVESPLTAGNVPQASYLKLPLISSSHDKSKGAGSSPLNSLSSSLFQNPLSDLVINNLNEINSEVQSAVEISNLKKIEADQKIEEVYQLNRDSTANKVGIPVSDENGETTSTKKVTFFNDGPEQPQTVQGIHVLLELPIGHLYIFILTKLTFKQYLSMPMNQNVKPTKLCYI